MEQWRDCPGYEGLYKVSNLGNIYSVRHNKLIAGCLDHQGYPRFVACKDGERRTIKIHRLVALAFIPNPDSLPVVDHINGDRSDNRVENLRWVTHSENSNNLWMHRRIAELEARVSELEAIVQRNMPD